MSQNRSDFQDSSSYGESPFFLHSKDKLFNALASAPDVRNQAQVSVFRQPELKRNALHVYLEAEEKGEDDGRKEEEEEEDEDLDGDDDMEVR